MRRYFLFVLTITSALCAHAQAIKVPVGKQFQVVTSTSTTTVVTVMGQSVDNVMDAKVIQDFTVKDIQPSGYTLSLVPKKISGKVSVMGMEQSFDSDDTATKNNAQLGASLAFIGKPQEVKVNNGIVTTTGDMKNMLSSIGMNADNQNDIAKLFLSIPDAVLKNGYTWSDSIKTNTFSVVNNYIVTSVTDLQVEVRATSETKMNTTMNQGGVDMQTDMKGFSTSIRSYDRKSGLMITEKTTAEITGTTEGMGIKAPMNIKVSAQSTVQ